MGILDDYIRMEREKLRHRRPRSLPEFLEDRMVEQSKENTETPKETPKIIKDWLRLIPDEQVRNQALYYAFTERTLDESATSLYSAIGRAFDWTETKEGAYYWHDIQQKYRYLTFPDLINKNNDGIKQQNTKKPDKRNGKTHLCRVSANVQRGEKPEGHRLRCQTKKLQLQAYILATEQTLADKREELEKMKMSRDLDFKRLSGLEDDIEGYEKGLERLMKYQSELFA